MRSADAQSVFAVQSQFLINGCLLFELCSGVVRAARVAFVHDCARMAGFAQRAGVGKNELRDVGPMGGRLVRRLAGMGVRFLRFEANFV